jgi:hypothetical protein
LQCRFCGEVVDPRRVDLGYDYCTRDDCQRRGLRRIELARVAINKAADQFVRAEDVLPAAGPAPAAPDADERDVVAPSLATSPRRPPARKKATSPHEKLRLKETELDAALARSYDRFCRGEVTVAEMNVERNQLIRAFNQLVLAENIRYRSMLRKPF